MQRSNAVIKNDHKLPYNKVRKQSTLEELALRFAGISRPSAKDITLFKEQFYTLILSTDAPDRKKVSHALSKSEYVPKAIIIFLAMEEIAIATQPLLQSPILQSSDINLIIKSSSYEHAKVIARRDNLDLSNVQTLLNRDTYSGSIKLILAGNSDFAKDPQISTLIKDETVFMGQDEKPSIITTALPKKIEVKAGNKDLSKSLIELANKGGKLSRKPLGKQVKPDFTQFTKKQIERELLKSARSKDILAFSNSIQNFCNLSAHHTFDFLKTQNAGMLATLLRALDISEITAARILLMLNNNIGRNPQIFKVVTKKYSNLDHQECLNFFKKLGANFEQLDLKQDVNATRYALSLAARQRRTSLLQREKDTSHHNNDYVRLSA